MEREVQTERDVLRCRGDGDRLGKRRGMNSLLYRCELALSEFRVDWLARRKPWLA